MDVNISKEALQNYLILPKTFDIDLIDQSLGFRQVFRYIPEEVYSRLKDSENEKETKIFKLLEKGAASYSFAFSIPKLKVHISNYGIQQFEQAKVTNAQWWDVRDLGLSILKTADECISDALKEISNIEELKDLIPMFKSGNRYLQTPADVEDIYSINNSPDVFLRLQKLLNKALISNVHKLITKECLDLVFADENLLEFLKSALVYYALHYASLLPSFIFTTNSVVVQYEELPWQKSLVLDTHAKAIAGHNFLHLAETDIKVITDHIAANPEDFPCKKEISSSRLMMVKDSGLYLM